MYSKWTRRRLTRYVANFDVSKTNRRNKRATHQPRPPRPSKSESWKQNCLEWSDRPPRTAPESESIQFRRRPLSGIKHVAEKRNSTRHPAHRSGCLLSSALLRQFSKTTQQSACPRQPIGRIHPNASAKRKTFFCIGRPTRPQPLPRIRHKTLPHAIHVFLQAETPDASNRTLQQGTKCLEKQAVGTGRFWALGRLCFLHFFSGKVACTL